MTDAVAAAAVPRFDGAEAWARLNEETRAQIGAAALEAVIADLGCEITIDPRLQRAFAAAHEVCAGILIDLAVAAMPALDEQLASDDADQVLPLPSALGAVCRLCGCSQNDACGLGCSRVAEDLCSACEGAAS